MLSSINGFCSLHLPQVLRKENLFSLSNCTEIWDNSRDAAKAGDEMIVYTVYSENFKTKANSVPLQTPWTAKCSLHSLLASYVARRD